MRESQLRLARVGLEKVIGYLNEGVTGWIKSGFALDYIPQITGPEFVELQQQEADRIVVLDVREAGERAGGTIANSISIPLGKVASRSGELVRNKLLVVHCKGGYRSSIATSLLRRAGFRDVANLTGGFDAWKAAGLPCS